MLLDTSGLLCLQHKAEPFHKEARQLYKRASVCITHSYVLAEFVALATVRRLPRIPALTYIKDLQDNPDIEVLWVNEFLHREAMALLLSRQDKTYSLCDAVSFVLMHQRNITEALTTDHHFEQEGFQTTVFPSLIVLVGYGVAFYFLTLVLKTMPVGITYAVWAGLGIVLVTLVGAVLYNQAPDLPAIVGMGLIVAGVVVINVFSKTIGH